MDGQQPNSQPDPMKGRKEIADLLKNCQNGTSTKMKCPNQLTAIIFGRMNQRMITEGNPITPEHQQVLVDSFQNNDNLCQTLYKENSHVMLSNGQGLAYRLGKIFHSGISLTRNDEPKEKDGPK